MQVTTMAFKKDTVSKSRCYHNKQARTVRCSECYNAYHERSSKMSAKLTKKSLPNKLYLAQHRISHLGIYLQCYCLL